MSELFCINNGWDKVLAEEFGQDYCRKIEQSIANEYQNFKVFPPRDKIFAALKTVDYDDVRVCILGQDPYHGAGQANGMAFAVCEGVPFPPSLANIFKELKADLSVPTPRAGTLIGWAKQGVLLLNATLTVREAQPLSHTEFGWDKFTDAVIKKLSDRKAQIVFILWGAYAISKAKLIAPHHCIIQSPHPSPLSANRGFFGSKPFSRANKFLEKNKFQPIDWAKINQKESTTEIQTEISVPNTPLPSAIKAKSPPSSSGRASYYRGTGSITKI